MRRVFFFLAITTSLTEAVWAKPAKVLITRHANKVEHGYCLSLQGMERAQAFKYYFSKTGTYQHPPIKHIFAAYRGGKKPYIRPKQTCQPLADFLGIPLNIQYEPEQTQEIAKEIMTNPKYNNASVLLCWEHHEIPHLVEAFGGGKVDRWHGKIFDQVYVLTFGEDAQPKVEKVLQKLMFGDRNDFSEKPHPLPEIAIPCPSSKGTLPQEEE